MPFFLLSFLFPCFNVAPPAASSPAFLSFFFFFFAHMGPDEMFEGSQHPFAYQQGRSSTVYTSSAAPTGDCGSDCVPAEGEMLSRPSASPHLLTRCHARPHWSPSFTSSYTIGFFPPLSLIPCRNFTVREQRYFRKERLFTLPSYLNNKSTFRQRAASFVCDCCCCLATAASDTF